MPTIETGLNRAVHREDVKPTPSLLEFLDGPAWREGAYPLRAEFPSVFGAYPGGESFYIERDNKIVSHVALVVREYQHADFQFRVGLIGSVMTAPTFRGQGMASFLLRKALTELRRRGCVVAMLWSDNAEFYHPLGFHRAGQEVDFLFSATEGGEPLQSGPVREWKESDTPNALWRLYCKHSGRLDRSLEEEKALVKIPKTRIFISETEGKITSFIAVNKGSDFENYIHEWGGPTDEVALTVAMVQRRFFPDRNLTLIAPAFISTEAFRRYAIKRWGGVLGMFKLIQPNALMAVYGNYLRKKGHALNWKAGSLIATIGGAEYPLNSEWDYLKLAFGEGPDDDRPTLPFFLWGFDSI